MQKKKGKKKKKDTNVTSLNDIYLIKRERKKPPQFLQVLFKKRII